MLSRPTRLSRIIVTVNVNNVEIVNQEYVSFSGFYNIFSGKGVSQPSGEVHSIHYAV